MGPVQPGELRSWTGKLARRLRRRRRGGEAKRRSLHVESLEPRLLLSADFAPFAVELASVGSDLTLRFDEASQALQLVDGSDPAGAILAQRALAGTSAVRISGGEGDERLTLDASVVGIRITAPSAADRETSFPRDRRGAGLNPVPIELPLFFTGGAGVDTLVGPALDATWRISGVDAGEVAGLAFSGVESLVGADGNRDTFVLAQGATLSAGLDGGAGGFDTLVLEGAYQTAVFRGTGPHSGAVTLDGATLDYLGLEPITSNLPAADVVVDFEPVILDLIIPTTLSVSEDGGGNIVVSGSLIETVIVPTPSSSLTINVLGLATTVDLAALSFAGDLRVHTEKPAIAELLDLLPGVDPANQILVSGDLSLPGRDLILEADRIEVAAGVEISTRLAAGASGDISFSALEIAVGDGAALLADGLGGFSGGDLRLEAREADDLAWFLGILNFRDKQARAVVDIGAAELRGENIEVSALAATAKVVAVSEALTTDTRAVVVGDLDGAGGPDLVLGAFGEPTRLLRGLDGDDPFEGVAGEEITGPDPTTALALADVDGDGDLDLLVGNFGAANRLYLNDGSGGFGTPIDIGSEQDDTTSIAVGDVDGDGDPDLVVGNANATNRLYRNEGLFSGSFALVGDIGSDADDTRAIALADVDGANGLDVVVGNALGLNKLYLNDGSASPFAAPTVLELGTQTDDTRAIAVADLDGDGDQDVVVGNFGAMNLVYLGDGSADPFAGVAGSALGDEARDTTSLAIGDVAGSGGLDVVVGNFGDDDELFVNAGTADPLAGVAAQAFGDASATGALALARLDPGGLVDVVVGNAGEVDRVFLNDALDNPFADADGESQGAPLVPDAELVSRIDEASTFQFSLFAAVVLAQADAEV
jgi:hypothetical protein